ncbi:unnamed protein product [Mortierella alpina]
MDGLKTAHAEGHENKAPTFIYVQLGHIGEGWKQGGQWTDQEGMALALTINYRVHLSPVEKYRGQRPQASKMPKLQTCSVGPMSSVCLEFSVSDPLDVILLECWDGR